MAHGAEKYRDEDEADHVEIEARNGVENYCITARNDHMEEKLEGKFEAGHNQKSGHDALGQVDKSRFAEKDEFEAIDAHNTGRTLAVQGVEKTVGFNRLHRSRCRVGSNTAAANNNQQGRQCKRKKKRKGERVENERMRG